MGKGDNAIPNYIIDPKIPKAILISCFSTDKAIIEEFTAPNKELPKPPIIRGIRKFILLQSL